MRSETSLGWNPARLGDHVDLLVGFAFKSAEFTDDRDGIRLLRGDNVGQGRLRWHDARRWPVERTSEFKRYELKAGDVVLAMDRPWIEAGLKYASVRDDDVPSLLVQRVARLRGNGALSQEYLRYLIAGPQFTSWVLAVQTGTAIPHISGGQIADYPFCLPPRPEQERIASVLGALDDKIDSNRRLISSLGELTAAWFDHLIRDVETSVALGEVAEVIDCLHSRKPPQQPTGRLLLQLNNIRDDGLIDLEPQFLIGEADYANWTRRMELRARDCVITNVGRVGAVGRMPSARAALGRNMTGLRCRPEWPFPSVMIEALLSSRTRQAIDVLTDSGTVMNALNVRNIPRLPIPMLPESALTRRDSRSHLELAGGNARRVAHLGRRAR